MSETIQYLDYEGLKQVASYIPKPDGTTIKRNDDGTISVIGGAGGSSVVVDDALSSTSENPVQNKVIKEELDKTITGIKMNNSLKAKGTDGVVNLGTVITDISGKQDKITETNKLDYSLISGTPTIPTVNNATLTIQKNGTNIQTFNANQDTDATVNITVPTKVSELTNDSGYITSSKTYTLTQDSADGHKIIFTPSEGDATVITIPDNNTWRGIQNNLTSDSTEESLSAAQGKALKGLVDNKAIKATTLEGYGITNAATSAQGAKADSAVQTIKINGNEQTKTNGVVNLPAYPTTLPASDVSAWAKAENKPTYTAAEVGALASTVTHLSGDIATTEKGANNGVATLDSTGKIPSNQLPSYVDDVLEYAGTSAFPTSGESGKIYVDTTSNKTYRWGGSGYVEISESLALGETSATAYAGDKGKAVTDAFNTHKDNTDIHISSTEKATWNAKSDFSGSYNDLTNKPTIPSKVSDLTNDSGFTTNTGTITEIKMNGVSKGTSGSVDLGTVLTSGEQTTLSNADAGSNVYTFSDGSTITVKNGSKGSQGNSGTITVGTVSKGDTASVTNSGTNTNAVFDFVLPKGDSGNAATVSVGTVTTVESGTNASVTNRGTTSAAVLDFSIPKGAKGDDGTSATVSVGTVTKGDTASVTNSGTSTNATLNFVLPKGDKGDTGATGVIPVNPTSTTGLNIWIVT